MEKYIETEEKKEERLLSRGAVTGCMITTVFGVYGFGIGDIPLLFLCVSFLAFVLRPFAVKFCGGFGKPIANAMKGFSMALLAGAILLTIF